MTTPALLALAGLFLLLLLGYVADVLARELSRRSFERFRRRIERRGRISAESPERFEKRRKEDR